MEYLFSTSPPWCSELLVPDALAYAEAAELVEVAFADPSAILAVIYEFLDALREFERAAAARFRASLKSGRPVRRLDWSEVYPAMRSPKES